MIEMIQRELVKCSFITNGITDRSARFEIHNYLNTILASYNTETLWGAIQKFSENFKNRNYDEPIKNKELYFKLAFAYYEKNESAKSKKSLPF